MEFDYVGRMYPPTITGSDVASVSYDHIRKAELAKH
jgi:hypothetical protein